MVEHAACMVRAHSDAHNVDLAIHNWLCCKVYDALRLSGGGGLRSSREHCIPERGRSVFFEVETTEGELHSVNTKKQFHSGYGDGSRGEAP